MCLTPTSSRSGSGTHNITISTTNISTWKSGNARAKSDEKRMVSTKSSALSRLLKVAGTNGTTACAKLDAGDFLEERFEVNKSRAIAGSHKDSSAATGIQHKI